jgi:hypothetical protein
MEAVRGRSEASAPPPAEGYADYQSFVVRLRWVQREGKRSCQAMVQNVNTREKRYFGDLTGLVAYFEGRS